MKKGFCSDSDQVLVAVARNCWHVKHQQQ